MIAHTRLEDWLLKRGCRCN